MLLGYLAIWLVLFIERKAFFYFVGVIGGFTHLENLPLISDCSIEITLLGIGGRKCVDDAPILPLGSFAGLQCEFHRLLAIADLSFRATRTKPR